MKTIYNILIILLVSSCSSKVELGVVEVQGVNDINVRFTMDDEFDRFDPIYYEILNRSGQVIVPKHYLTGTDIPIDLTDFSAKISDNIIYISFLNEDIIYAIYDCNTKEGYPAPTEGEWNYVSSVKEKIVFKLKKSKPNLRFSWEK